jgi:kumamolisin
MSGDPIVTKATKYVPLRGSRRFHRPGAQVLGPADSGQWCEITVKVRRMAPLPEPVPDKPKTREELIAKYGANSDDLETVEKVLTSFGLTVISKSRAARRVVVAGPVSAMQQAFQVRLLRVKHNDIVYRGRIGEVHIPSELEGIVTGVFGLDTRPMIKRRKRLGLQAPQGTLPAPGQRSWYLPQELAQAYQFPQGDGTGQTIGILEFGGHYIPADLTAFLKYAGINATPNVTIKNVQTLAPQDQNDPDSIGEVMLDIEIVAALCPKATLAVYFSNWSEQGWVDNLDAVLADSTVPSVVSISYGLAEGSDIWTQTAIDQVNDNLKELANAGITVCVSSGDDGSDDQVSDGQAHLDFPASSPYCLSVGGTALTRATGQEVVWFDGDGLRRDQGGSGGGGVSEMNAKPSWQTMDIPSVNSPTIHGRIVPDVAANAAGSTGYFMVAQNNPEVSGGTSASTPLWASLIARIQQTGKTVGFLSPRLYAPTPATGGKPLGAVAFRDITQGSNASGTAPGYSAQEGFDAVTGWGSPIGAELLARLP